MWQYKENYEAGIVKIRSSFLKPVIQYDLQNNYIAEFPHTNAAASALNIQAHGIHRCASGKTSNYKNFIWKYKNV